MTHHRRLSRFPRLLAAALLAPLAACATNRAGLPADEVRCFAGTTEIMAPSGQKVATSETIARRDVMASRGMIVEDVISAGARPGAPAREFVVEMTVNGDLLTMVEKSGAFKGTGTLTGPAWRWTSWRTESTLPEGARVVSIDTLSNHTLTANKQIFDTNGKLQVSTVERLTEIPCDEFDKRRAEMLSAAPAAKPAAK